MTIGFAPGLGPLPALAFFDPNAGGGGAVVPLVRRQASCAETFFPTGGPFLFATPAVANVFTAWMNVTNMAPLAAAFILSEIYCVAQPTPGAITGFDIEYQSLASGIVDAIVDVIPIVDPSGDDAGYIKFSRRTRHVGSFPAGDTIQVRAQQTAAKAFNFETMLLGWASYPTFDQLANEPVLGGGFYLPNNIPAAAGANFITVLAFAAGWAGLPGGAGTQVLAAAPNDLLLTEIASVPAVGSFPNTGAYQLGYGAAGAETWVSTSILGHLLTSAWIWPPVYIKTGERIAIRGTGNAATPVKVKAYNV